MIAESRLVREALNTPYKEWESIESLIGKTKDAHTKEVLRRLMFVKRKRLSEENGNRIVATQQHY
jgi:hypothetical protein